jgi:hypothetical protein
VRRPLQLQKPNPVLMLRGRYNSSANNLMSELARNFVDLQSQLAAAVCRVTIHVPAALSALAGDLLLLLLLIVMLIVVIIIIIIIIIMIIMIIMIILTIEIDRINESIQEMSPTTA